MSSIMTMSGYSTVEEIAQHLGVSVKTVRRLYTSGQIPISRIGRRIRIKFEDVEAAFHRTLRHLNPTPRRHPSAVDAAGRAIAYAPAEVHQRTRLALAALDVLNGEEFDDPDQDRTLALLEANLIRNREGGDLASTG